MHETLFWCLDRTVKDMGGEFSFSLLEHFHFCFISGLYTMGLVWGGVFSEVTQLQLMQVFLLSFLTLI